MIVAHDKRHAQWIMDRMQGMAPYLNRTSRFRMEDQRTGRSFLVCTVAQDPPRVIGGTHIYVDHWVKVASPWRQAEAWWALQGSGA